MNCPHCRTLIEWIDQPKVRAEKRAIKDGDNFVCADCGTVSVMESGSLRLMTAAEFLSRGKESREIIHQLRGKRQ